MSDKREPTEAGLLDLIDELHRAGDRIDVVTVRVCAAVRPGQVLVRCECGCSRPLGVPHGFGRDPSTLN